MKRALPVTFLLVCVFILGGAVTGYAQENAESVPVAAMESDSGAGTMASELDVLWLWGEVVSVAPDNNQVVVKYLDYESDTEKDLTLSVDEKTAYENVKSLGELRVQDTVSVDYVVSAGKNLAKNISVEKPEGVEPMVEEGADMRPGGMDASQPEAMTEAPAEEAQAPAAE